MGQSWFTPTESITGITTETSGLGDDHDDGLA
jgi:hypothetical protein